MRMAFLSGGILITGGDGPHVTIVITLPIPNDPSSLSPSSQVSIPKLRHLKIRALSEFIWCGS